MNHEERIQQLEEEIVELKEKIQFLVDVARTDYGNVTPNEILEGFYEWSGRDRKEDFETTCRRCGKPITWFDFDKKWWHDFEGSNGFYCDKSGKMEGLPK